jgi:hypothetical protein
LWLPQGGHKGRPYSAIFHTFEAFPQGTSAEPLAHELKGATNLSSAQVKDTDATLVTVLPPR